MQTEQATTETLSSTHPTMIATQTVALAVVDDEPVLAVWNAQASDEVVIVFI